jgi:hypothetical protein
MARPKAAQRAAAENVAASLTALLSPARAAASRRNGARSRGPKTADGKACSAQNALKHGLCAEKFVVGDEDHRKFAAFEAALMGELAPEGAVQGLLAGRIVRAAWRLRRADRIEAELFAREMEGPFGDGDLGLALIRDGNGARAFDTLLRYRASARAELFRALRTLRELQAETRAEAQVVSELPNQPEARSNPRQSRAGAASAMPPVPGSATPSPGAAPGLGVDPALVRQAAGPLHHPNRRSNPMAAEILAKSASQVTSAGIVQSSLNGPKVSDLCRADTNPTGP